MLQPLLKTKTRSSPVRLSLLVPTRSMTAPRAASPKGEHARRPPPLARLLVYNGSGIPLSVKRWPFISTVSSHSTVPISYFASPILCIILLVFLLLLAAHISIPLRELWTIV
ncbi:hypothetical protein ASPBRDRAFT_389284 [Aspergillus brasiliensis CBS 101740]|uniref:Uncharacterized protein n=1 Tax=Aspergillus brasiliensis (strain CBS 101740 / IMI 381727 / IBT 21946) TaxID=767769 RepID=A0A1L9UWN4_ASPBC|nr:hypothetical protein ASPBRDRAFT_389284 [Aspergillus brasiliensis CBS 101740]